MWVHRVPLADVHGEERIYARFVKSRIEYVPVYGRETASKILEQVHLYWPVHLLRYTIDNEPGALWRYKHNLVFAEALNLNAGTVVFEKFRQRMEVLGRYNGSPPPRHAAAEAT